MKNTYQKGHKKLGGRVKGTKNKTTLLFQFTGFTEEDKLKVYKAALKLVEKGNVTIISKFLDKMFPNALPKDDEGNFIMPEIKFNVIDHQNPA